jgi:16S rRNA (guanine(966)-N(2))-methyltransferase RsmD
MRIIAGERRGMKLLSPKTDETRPITDRVKESLFNVLQKYGPMNGKYIADLFCGTGSLGLEALSRGAGLVTFVERSSVIIQSLKKNIEKAGFVNRSEIVKADIFKVADITAGSGHRYDIIFVDPPYVDTEDVLQSSPLGKLLARLTGYIAQNGIVLVRTRRAIVLAGQYDRLVILDRREWGTMAVTILGLGNDE